MECPRVLEQQQYHHQHSQQPHSLALLGSQVVDGGGRDAELVEGAAGRAVVRTSGRGPQGCTVLDLEMEVQQGGLEEQGNSSTRVSVLAAATGPVPCSTTSANTSSSSAQGEHRGGSGGTGGGERLASEAAEPGGDSAQLPFSRELITFSLFGKMPPKFRHNWKESLNSRIAEVQQAFKNIPEMLYFSPSSVALHGIGVYAAESLPKDTLLGPYLGKPIRKDQVNTERNNPWLWEVYEDDALAYFIDARDPKYGNWMNFIQCARSSMEQNLRMAQYNNHLYFVVTLDIQIGEELLVWYDQEQYDTYMGLPTGFRELPPPPLFQEQGGTAQGNNAGHSSPSAPPPSLQDHLAPPTFASFCGHASSGGGSFSDSASTDDSGLSMETNGGPTPPTFDPSSSHHHAHPPQHQHQQQRDGGPTTLATPPETACPLPPEGAYHHAPQTVPGGSNPQLLPGMMPRGNTLPSAPTPPSSSSSSEAGGFVYAAGGAGLRVESTAEQLQQWYVSPLTASAIATTADKPTTNNTTPPDGSPAHTPSENHTSWVGTTRPYVVDSPTSSSLPGMTLLPSAGGGVAVGGGKKQLLYGLFSRSEDGSRWHCEECKRLFSSQGSLRAHARIHTGERPYQCQYCFRAFCQASTLRSHERLHTGEKPYKCEDCGRAFTQSAGLRSHRKTHRYDT